MKDLAKKTSYIGAGVGMVLFAIFGLLPGSLVGGAMGLNIVGAVFGTPVTSSLIPRAIVGLSMLTGVMASCLIFVSGAALAGWLLAAPVEMLRGSLKRDEKVNIA
ncbi:MAG: hypothetical protein Kow0025_08820 [Thermodesulfovibrionales bacterium]